MLYRSPSFDLIVLDLIHSARAQTCMSLSSRSPSPCSHRMGSSDSSARVTGRAIPTAPTYARPSLRRVTWKLSLTLPTSTVSRGLRTRIRLFLSSEKEQLAARTLSPYHLHQMVSSVQRNLSAENSCRHRHRCC